MEQLLQAWPLLLVAVAMGLAVILGLALTLDVGNRFRLEWMGLFFAAVPLTMVVGVVLQGRVLGVEVVGLAPDADESGASNWASRAITLLCLAVAFERAARFVLRREYQNVRGGRLLVALMLYLLAVNLVSPLLGTRPNFSHHLLYAPIFALAVFAYAQANSDQCVVITRNALLVFMLVSLVALALRVDMVAESNYRAGLVPGFSLRFYGFATHPNTLAPLCFVLMCALLLKPYALRWLNRFAWGLVSICLLLTQSKTSIGLVVILIGSMLLFRAVRILRLQGKAEAGRVVMPLITGLFLAAAAGGLLVLFGLLTGVDIVDKLERKFDFQQLSTLTGRTTIWAETLTAVRANPLFGYGPGLWGPEFRVNTGMMFAHAHNQYLQTLGAGGIFGLLALLTYVLVMLITAWRARVSSQGVTLALAVYLIVRGATEVPLSASSAMQGEFLVQMFLLALCVAHLPAVHPRSACQSSIDLGLSEVAGSHVASHPARG